MLLEVKKKKLKTKNFILYWKIKAMLLGFYSRKKVTINNLSFWGKGTKWDLKVNCG